MKFRHSSILAVVGWYLMMPPTSHTLRALSQADFSKWKAQASYASAAECEQARVQTPQSASQSAARPNLRNAKQQYLAHRATGAQCVSSDDPRLKSQ